MLSLLLISSLAGAPAPLEAMETAPSSSEGQGTEADSVAATRPTVHLVVDEALTEWLVVRLLEDGYPLTASAEAANVELRVVADAEGSWSVTATGQTAVAFDVEAATDLAVIRLELLHRSIDALEDVVPVVPKEPNPVDISLAVIESSPPSLAPQVAAGILAAGATLVPTGSPAQLRVCADQRGEEQQARISVIDGESECDEESLQRSVALLPSTTPMVAAAMATLAEADAGVQELADAESETSVPVTMEPVEDRELAPGLEAAPSRIQTPRPGAPIVFRGGIAAGVIGRVSVADALLAASMSIGKEPGIQGWLEMQVRPANVVGPLRVTEYFPAIGFKVRPLSVGRVSIEMGALLGPEIHRYRLRAEPVSGRGSDISGSVESALGVAVAVREKHEIHIAVRAGAGSERIHRVEGQEVWRRRSLRLGATIGFTFGKGLRT